MIWLWTMDSVDICLFNDDVGLNRTCIYQANLCHLIFMCYAIHVSFIEISIVRFICSVMLSALYFDCDIVSLVVKLSRCVVMLTVNCFFVLVFKWI